MNISSTHRMMAAVMISTATTLPLAAIAHADPTDTTANSYNVESPAGDLRCTFDSDSIGANDGYGQVMCEVVNRNWEAPPLPAKCPNPHEPVFVLSARPAIGPGGPGAIVQCYANNGVNLDSDFTTLDYGQTLVIGPITCESEPSGITCTNTTSGHFFRESRDSYDVG